MSLCSMCCRVLHNMRSSSWNFKQNWTETTFLSWITCFTIWYQHGSWLIEVWSESVWDFLFFFFLISEAYTFFFCICISKNSHAINHQLGWMRIFILDKNRIIDQIIHSSQCWIKGNNTQHVLWTASRSGAEYLDRNLAWRNTSHR